jgi:acyl dehydratase
MNAGVTVPALRAFEDFSVGLRFQGPRATAVTAEQIRSFAARFDPQPAHLDEEAGRRASFGGLVASGWHTAAIAMRLIVDSDLGLCGQGAGIAVESMRWRVPVRPGDVLRVEGSVVETRPSRSHPDRGIVKLRVLVLNEHDEAVLEASHVVLVARRGALPGVG